MSLEHFIRIFSPIVKELHEWHAITLIESHASPPMLQTAVQPIRHLIHGLVERLGASLPLSTSPAMKGMRSLLGTSKTAAGLSQGSVEGVERQFIEAAFKRVEDAESKDAGRLFIEGFYALWGGLRSEPSFARYLREPYARTKLVTCIESMRTTGAVPFPSALDELLEELHRRGQNGCFWKASSGMVHWRYCYGVMLSAAHTLVRTSVRDFSRNLRLTSFIGH